MSVPTLFDLSPGLGGPPADAAGVIGVPAAEARDAAAPALTLVVYGLPGPQGSKSFKGFSKAGKPILAESSKKVKPWRQAVHDAALEKLLCCADPDCGLLKPGFPLDGPLVGRVVFTLPKPASAPKTKRTWPDRYPDTSKLLRATEDALTKLAWADDARLVDYTRVGKVFPGEDAEALSAPGARLWVWRLADLGRGAA